MFQAQFLALMQSLNALIQQLQTWIDHAGGVLPDPVPPVVEAPHPAHACHADSGPTDPPHPSDPPGPVDPPAPAEINGWTVVAGTRGDDQMQGHAGVADLFLVTAGHDVIQGFEQGIDHIWVRDPVTIGGEALGGIITEQQVGDETRFGTPATWLDGPDGAHTGVVLVLDQGTVEVHGMTEIGTADWVFGDDVPAPEVVEDWAFA